MATNYTEFSYYELYLLDYLLRYHPDKANDMEFIHLRAESASVVFEESRLQGYSIISAQELAMACLVTDLHFSRHYLILQVLETEFSTEIPSDQASPFAVKVAPHLEEVFSKYLLTEGAIAELENTTLYTEITGAIALYLEEHGL